MAIVTTDNRYYSEIASAIREMSGSASLYTPAQMAAAIRNIQAGEAMSIETIWGICGYDPNALPSGYTRLDCIISTGTQYIDTGFVPNQNSRIVLDYQNEGTSFASLCGSQAAANTSSLLFYLNSSTVYPQYGNSKLEAYSVAKTTNNRFVYDLSASGAKVGDTTVPVAVATFSAGCNATLFVVNIGGTLDSRKAVGKLYSCQIYDNDVLVRDYVPCINPSGAVGLYDRTGKQFYGNKGTGSFIAGIASELPDGYAQISYIQSNGTQYINTGFKPNQDTRVVIDFENEGDYSGMTTSLCPFLGARNGSSSAVFALWIGTKTFPQYGNVAYNKNGNFTTDLNNRLTYDFNKNVVSIGGDSITCASATFTTNHDLCVLTINNYGTIESRRASGKLYACQIYDNGNLVRDYVPCINPSGAFGLYDKVHNKFYTNAGSGSFTGG